MEEKNLSKYKWKRAINVKGRDFSDILVIVV